MSRKLSRRGFLAGIGATVALPYLESVSFEGAASTAKAAGEQPVFTMIFKQGNGVQQGYGDEPDRFWPSALGALTPEILRGRDSGRAVSELADFADELCIVSGLNAPYGGGSCGHARGLAQLLSANQWLVGDRHARASQETVDWFIARRCNPEGVAPLHFAAGAVEGNYVSGTLSYRGSNDPYPAQNNPYAAYLDLFGDGTPTLEEQVALRRRSVNDLVRAELTELMGSAQLGSADRQRLQHHFDFIRDVELRMCDALPPEAVADMREVRDSLTANDVREDIMRMFMDLTAVAFSCNLNRSAVLQMGPCNDNTRYYIDGVRQNSFHRISHRIDSDGAEGAPIANADLLHHQIDRIHARMFRHFLESLRGYTGPSGRSLLYDTTAVWTNDLSNGPPHALNNLPFVVAGSGGGFLRQGLFVDAGGTTHNKMLNTLISAHGITAEDGGHYDSFGGAELEGGVIEDMIAGA